eukprot:TRINITY_DN4139_c0_g1_i1.p1 TRINITY_DN4139_c0_g1~~TRINITY_DN4139_c0_g1_i1.p1  ORF type:complete len:240 (+),score=14.69 TRINITY_DN4139_c0_g1_i1:115-834(+)
MPWPGCNNDHIATAIVSPTPEARLLTFSLLASHLLRWCAVDVRVMASDSMAPTVRRGDWVLHEKGSCCSWLPSGVRRKSRRGDVVVFTPPDACMCALAASSDGERQVNTRKRGRMDFTKRVVAVEGDRVRIRRYGEIIVNGVLVEPPSQDQGHGSQRQALWRPGRADSTGGNRGVRRRFPVWQPGMVPHGHIFVAGDDRGSSFDSRFWGYLDTARVLGRAVCVCWPPQRWRWLRPCGSG